MGKPKHGGRAIAIELGYFTCLKRCENSRELFSERNRPSERPLYRLDVVVDPKVDGEVVDVGGEEVTNIIRKREAGSEWYRRDLAKVVTH